ncbi:hypothetical protein [Desertibacillus haloalkaliphilus]|uniref:hypothetical protein n=1 Tax=Desertibacillus haloalkaliphilus TaxID=1328930 RepID=UPI001C2659A0|nr:hypothetical protein [Desertibacillus haloalkaliphilus]MBU8906806.1 hypothetical protein [Desertibacillus haloalkaliphilus]
MDTGDNFYERLPLPILADFYVEIKRNIDRHVLSERMYTEIELIKKAMTRKGVSEWGLYTHSKRAEELGLKM